MPCYCAITDIITDNIKLMDMEKECLILLKIDAFKWKTLYKCRFCNTFWEERYIENRFVGMPQLIKVDKDYVKKEWKIVMTEL